MKTMFTVAAPLLITACANLPNPSIYVDGAGREPVAYYYCWEDKVDDRGDRILCNWEANARDACDAHQPRYLEKSLLSTEPEHFHRCDNGKYLVRASAK